jgi:hypothetical protein
VCLWLGANVMLEYTLEEVPPHSRAAPRGPRCSALPQQPDVRRAQAAELLSRNHANALSNLDAVKREVLALRDSITTTEARARCFRVAAVLRAADVLRVTVHRCASRASTTLTSPEDERLGRRRHSSGHATALLLHCVNAHAHANDAPRPAAACCAACLLRLASDLRLQLLDVRHQLLAALLRAHACGARPATRRTPTAGGCSAVSGAQRRTGGPGGAGAVP